MTDRLRGYSKRTVIDNFIDDYDHETPECTVCNEKVGLHNDALLVLPGQFFFNREEGYAMYILDPDIRITFLEIPDALGPGQSQFAVIIDAQNPAPAAVTHTACAEDEFGLVEEEDEEDDPEELETQMHGAMDRDHDINWDDHDMINQKVL